MQEGRGHAQDHALRRVEHLPRAVPLDVLAAREGRRAKGVRLGAAAARRAGVQQIGLIGIGSIALLALGLVAPASFLQHFVVFVLACFVGFQVIWNVSHALHTPLMAVTNAISGIIIIGALLQIGTGNWLVWILAAISVLIATINIVGGFMVTRRMLAMFQKS